MIDIPPINETRMGPASTISSGTSTSYADEYDEKTGASFSWPPGQAFQFEPLPPYPAGPNLSKIRYPKEVTCPRYQCPHCDEHFLFHSLNGLVTCPFCYTSIAIGEYNRKQMIIHFIFAIILLLVSITVTVLVVTILNNQLFLCIPAILLFFSSIIFFTKALQSRDSYEEAKILIEDCDLA